MLYYLSFPLMQVLLYFTTCNSDPVYKTERNQQHRIKANATFIKTIPLPAGFRHIRGSDSAFADWLLSQPLKKDNTVYLYNGGRKANQHAQFAVLDMEIGKKDLLQCADAVIKLKAGFLFQSGKADQINFRSTSGTWLSFLQWQRGYSWKIQDNKLERITRINNFRDSAKSVETFMDIVYSYCGTYSLSRQLKPVEGNIQPGDVFIQGGFPGHAVIVLSVAENRNGKKIFMLAQGYMPAQDIHVLRNPGNPGLNPWYSEEETDPLVTPQWKFNKGSLMRW